MNEIDVSTQFIAHCLDKRIDMARLARIDSENGVKFLDREINYVWIGWRARARSNHENMAQVDALAEIERLNKRVHELETEVFHKRVEVKDLTNRLIASYTGEETPEPEHRLMAVADLPNTRS